jgi:hypothetical protein
MVVVPDLGAPTMNANFSKSLTFGIADPNSLTARRLRGRRPNLPNRRKSLSALAQ